MALISRYVGQSSKILQLDKEWQVAEQRGGRCLSSPNFQLLYPTQVTTFDIRHFLAISMYIIYDGKYNHESIT